MNDDIAKSPQAVPSLASVPKNMNITQAPTGMNGSRWPAPSDLELELERAKLIIEILQNSTAPAIQRVLNFCAEFLTELKREKK